ncbi:hypothetical protein VTN77DRAFT_976 [Rasamsonia byssochlamydoides]|uniref:uncharacterized protein n=1 Tax=Rasamsonia byssochlamydoides TaxID=89139 RepID=UPI003743B660
MAARIHLDRPHGHFTNLDYLTGKVILQLHSDTSISEIYVKLEGESRTRLSGPRYGSNDRSEKKKTELEVHKILYKVTSVFPSPDIAQHSSPNAAFTLPPGTYEYPFRFKFPFNNSCSNHNSMMTNISMAGLRVEVARDTDQHVKKTLPPSMKTFPGEAEIRYYVKATVVRPQFYKENIRAFADFNFLPIEPPRSGNPNEEMYARRQQEFAKPVAPAQRKGGLFRKRSMPAIPVSGEPPLRVSVDARLPNPPILTCNEPIPLRILVTKQSTGSEMVYLQLLHIELISYTHIRAHDLARTESVSMPILSRSNMNMPLGNPNDPVGKEWKIDASMWNRLPLPPYIAPSFETCNIRRNYEMEVRVGLSYGAPGGVQSPVMVLPLRLAVKVYSGIAPPPALLEAMAAEGKIQRARPEVPPRPSADEDTPPPVPQRPTPAAAAAGPTPGPGPALPAVAPAPGPVPPAAAPVFNPIVAIQQDEIPDEAPPSYEDAMAEGIGPIDGPRPEYNPPNTSADRGLSSGPVTDAKTPVDSHHEKVYAHVHHSSTPSHASSESLDMLPTTPGSPRPESLAESWIEEHPQGSTTTTQPSFEHPHKGEQPQYLTTSHAHGAQQVQQQLQQLQLQQQQPGTADHLSPQRPGPGAGPARLSIRTFSGGVPSRRPVPGTGTGTGTGTGNSGGVSSSGGATQS